MPTLIRKYIKIGRNEKCPCGSGKKFKACCENKPQQHDALTIEPKQLKFHIDMTNIILNYLATDRTFDAGVQLYHRYGKNKHLLRKFNLQGESKENLELLHFKLFMLTGLPEKTFTEMMLKPVAKPQPKPEVPVQPKTAPAAITLTPIEATKKRIRDEFPFLADKNCPDAFKILVADMITSYENYINAHQQLFDVKDEKEAFEVADKVIDNYLDNRAIWDELNHYKATGKILGKHKYFDADKRRKELMSKPVPELIKLKEQLEMNIWRNLKKMKDDPKPHLIKDRQERLEGYETDLKIVRSLLNINE